ncbi:amino acid adenylation domain-containing protein [Pseudomonas sp. LAMO17WK12:I10]|uniref:non-ribosomal peptide synthetase n=1 Tax=unclassified Pseudomonas TaxID=196821 RepID=UPI000BC5159C|nr:MULTISPECIES: non-ribosomal peptide synthetase [unclassified Pseudomonas]PXX69494.1 amino acid adenylation domain-containing protein [Pseudomonas sp. LAMO17WK12:I9]SNY32800.1 amino acid adenylation domain-containing protein [Pseudomonas sp. LAMO17WK12:I10]
MSVKDLQSVKNTIRCLLAETLGVAAEEISESTTFFELGLTSRIGVMWMAQVNQTYRLSIPAVRVFNYPTLARMAELVHQELAAQEGEGSAQRPARTMFGRRPAPIAPALVPAPIAREQAPAVALGPRKLASFRRQPRGNAQPVETPPVTAPRAPAARPAAATTDAGAIAIIGLSGRFPQARNVQAFWEAVAEGRDCISRVDRDYWRMDQAYSPTRQAGKSYCDFIGAVDDIDRFDPLFFNISPADADDMDPQQRLFLQEAWSCLEDAGLHPQQLAGSKCGVFVGCGNYGQSQNGNALSAAGFLGGSTSILAARIAYLLDLRGPCLTIDTACSASLVAIAQACDSLVMGNSDLALAGGVSILSDPSIHIMASQAGMLSTDGRCYSFDQRANGFVPAEGVGVVALKRLADARRDNDPIYGTLIGWGVNQDGKTNGITAPSQTSQAELQQAVFRQFDIDPRTLGLMEAHGSGTPLGDPIEVEALVNAFKPFTGDCGFCALGSVKSNMGHMLAAAGVAGFFKALLAIRHRRLPPSAQFQTLNEHIRLDQSPFFIHTDNREWTVPAGTQRRAGVSSFGFSGTNAYLVLQEYPQPAPVPAAAPAAQVIVLSARNEERLRAYASALQAFLRTQGATLCLEDLAYTLQVGRLTMDARLALVADSVPAVAEALAAYLAGSAGDERDATLFHGKPAVERDALLDAEEVPAMALRWAQEGKWAALARLWVRRGGFDWRPLWARRGEPQPRRVSLPGYPFARRPCQMPVFQAPGAPAVAEGLSPLLQRNVSTFEQLAFRSVFHGDEFYFADHVIAGRKTLPGVAYLEMACTAGYLAAGQAVSRVRNIVWLQPFLVDREPATLELRLKQKNSKTRFEIHDLSHAGEPLCAQGEIVLDATVPEPPSVPQLAALLAGARLLDERAGCYARFDAQGFAYGPSFRAINTLSRSGCYLIADIQRQAGASQGQQPVPAGLAEHYRLLDGFVLNPALLDSAFQPCIRFCEDEDPSSTYIPYALDQITVFKALPERFYSVAQLREIDGESAQCSVHILSESGELLVHIDNLTLRPLKVQQAALPSHLYRMDWLPATPAPGIEAAQLQAPRLLFVADAQIAAHLARPQDILVYPAAGFRCVGPRHYELAPGNPDDYARLWDACANPALTVVHAWALGAPVELQQALTLNLYSLVFISQQLIRGEAAKGTVLLHFYPHDIPAAVAVGGFMRGLAAEQPSWVARSVGLPGHSAQRLADLMEGEIGVRQQPGQGVEVRLEEDRRLVLAAVPDTQAATGDDALREGGVYLISGGAGGLGLILARALVEDYRARVFLTGRTPAQRLAPAIQQQLEALNRNEQRGQVEYLAADITDAQGCVDLLARVRQRVERIHGVFHCAGIMENAALANKSAEQIARIVNPKAIGVTLLDKALEHEALDLFVVYSSISAVMGFSGQTDYGYANRFLDSFVAQRQRRVQQGIRQGRSLAINWTLWRDGGMRIDEQSELFLERSRGLVALDADAGIAALKRSLATEGATQRVVIQGQAGIVQAAWNEFPQAPRGAAPAPRPTPSSGAVAQGPSAVAERTLVELAELLKLAPADIDPDQDLMKYGLDSIGAMMLINKINDAFDINVQPAALLRHTSLKAFTANICEEHLAESASAAVPQPEPLPVATPVPASAPAVAVSYPDPYLAPMPRAEGIARAAPLADVEVWPMSHGQQALWFIHKLNEDSAAYHIAMTFRLRSPLDRVALERSYSLLVQRHPALRTRFSERLGQPVQEIPPVALPDFGVSNLVGQSREQVQQALQSAHRQPFDLQGALSRLRLFICGEHDTLVLWTVHHLVSDAWSQWLLLDELLSGYAALCRGEQPRLAPLTASFADFVREEEAFLLSAAGQRQRDFWKHRLADPEVRLNLPLDFPRPKAQTFNGASVAIQCDSALSAGIKALALREGVTVFTVLLAAYQCLLGRYSSDRQVWIGSPVSGRIDQRFNPLVGYFVNSVVLAADLRANPSFSELLRQQKQVVLEALENQRVPFAKLVQDLNPSREAGRTPLFQAEFVYQKPHQDSDLIRILSPREGLPIQHQGLQLESLPFAQQEGQFEIGLEMMDIDGQLAGALKFNADLFAASTMTRMTDSFLTLLQHCVSQPGTPVWSLPVVAGQDRARSATWLQGIQVPVAPLTTAQLFEQQVLRQAAQTALIDPRRSWSYEALNQRANRLAHHLQAAGLRQGQGVALCMQRSGDLVAALLAVFKAGAFYIPMDPGFPAQRLQHMVEDARPAFMVVDSLAGLPQGLSLEATTLLDLAAQAGAIDVRPADNLPCLSRMQDCAYVIYTSGSTGRPKGVQIGLQALSNFLQSMGREPGLSAQDRLLAVTTISFDIAALELYLPLVNGACVVLASREAAMDGLQLQRLLDEQRITLMQATPTTWQMLVSSGWAGKPDLRILCGGEPLPRSLARELLSRSRELWNLYGPTETTIWSCVERVDGQGESAIVPIGKPVQNTRLYILDGARVEVPPGVAGELCIGGEGVAIGYLNRPDLNAEKFIQAAADRVYRTGDQARLTPQGQLEFLGREDGQLKVRGFRIEAGEIENILRGHPQVRDCVVTLRQRGSGDDAEGVLTAYVVIGAPVILDEAFKSDLRQRVARELPAYMVPSLYVRLDALPLTPNNKIDRKALPAPETVEAASSPVSAAPGRGERVGLVWAAILGLPQARDDSHFFNAGGTSFTATRLIYQIQQELGITLPVSLLFEHPTLGSFAGALERHARGNAAPLPVTPPQSAEPVADDPDQAVLEILAQLQSGRLSVDQANRLMGDFQ